MFHLLVFAGVRPSGAGNHKVNPKPPSQPAVPQPRSQTAAPAAWFNQIVDINRPLLSQAMDAPDALLEHGGIPGQLQVDARVGGLLQIQPHAARIAEKQDRGFGVVVKIDQILGPAPQSFLAGEEHGAQPLRRE
jgi:hypothetical protein